jgi:hypothetical protein
MATTINTKVNHIYKLLEKLSRGEILYAQNKDVQQELDLPPKN